MKTGGVFISRSILVRMRNVSEKKIVEKIKTHFVFRNSFFFKENNALKR